MRTMRNKAVWVVALFAALASAGVSPGLLAKDAQPAGNAVEVSGSESVLSMRVDGELLITQDGRVGEYKVTTDGLPEEVTSLIDQSIATWRFEPVMDAKGAPVVARTYMRMTLVARELEGKRYAMGLENVRFHDGTKRNESAEVRERAKQVGVEVVQKARPSYPSMMAANRVSGAALVNVLLAPGGTVEDAVVVQSAMFNVRGKSALMEKAFGEMEREAVRGVKRMRVRFGAGVDPSDPEISSGLLLINFDMTGKPDQDEARRKAGIWRIEQRGPLRSPAWEIEKARTRLGISDMDGSEGYMSATGNVIKPTAGVPTL